MEDQMSTCSCCCKKNSVKGSDCGGSQYGKHNIHKNNQRSDVSSVSEIQEMAFTIGGLHH